MLVEFLLHSVLGRASDRIGLKPVYYIGVIGLLVMAFPFFWLLSTGSYGAIMLTMFLGLPFCHGVYDRHTALHHERSLPGAGALLRAGAGA